jgi:hypothetical protein
MKLLEGFTDDIYIIVGNRVIEEKPRNIRAYFSKAIIVEIERSRTNEKSGDKVPEYIRQQIERDRQEEKQREMEQLRGSKVDQEELDRLIAELEGLE